MQRLRLWQVEAGRWGAPGNLPNPRLLGRRPALLKPRLQAAPAGSCVSHALPALFKSPLEAWILQSSLNL